MKLQDIFDICLSGVVFLTLTNGLVEAGTVVPAKQVKPVANRSVVFMQPIQETGDADFPLFQEIHDTEQELLDHQPDRPSAIPAYLAEFVKQYGGEDPELRRNGIRLLYHLSHGAFFDEGYQQRWADALAANFRLDIAKIRALHAALETSEKKLVEDSMQDLELISRRIGNVVPVEVVSYQVQLPVAFGDRQLPLSFDLNTVQARVLGLVPGIQTSEIESFAKRRDQLPFKDLEDLAGRNILSADTMKKIRQMETDQ